MEKELTNEIESKCDTKEIRLLLIEFLSTYSVRKDMCLPILLMIGESKRSMLHLMLYMRDKNPSEHEIIQMASQLQSASAK